jgi:hypothetical protein
MIANHYNYLYSKKLDLNINSIKNSCLTMHQIIMDNFADLPGGYPQKDLYSTHVFNQYNLLMYPLDQFYELYFEIQKLYKEISQVNTQMYIQCWLNFYNKGQYIDWHGHWGTGSGAYHGFFCVDVEPDSHTSYKFPIDDEIKFIDIESKNNLLVIGKTDRDQHKSSEWNHDYPRITIAYDIVPKELVPLKMLNHWMPI